MKYTMYTYMSWSIRCIHMSWSIRCVVYCYFCIWKGRKGLFFYTRTMVCGAVRYDSYLFLGKQFLYKRPHSQSFLTFFSKNKKHIFNVIYCNWSTYYIGTYFTEIYLSRDGYILVLPRKLKILWFQRKNEACYICK